MLEINFSKEEKIQILKARGLKIKTVTEKFPSKFGGEYYKRMVDYVVNPSGDFVITKLDVDAGQDYYIDQAFNSIVKSKLMNIFLAL